MEAKYNNLVCLHCGSEKVVKAQFRKNKKSVKPIYRCKDCNRRFSLGGKFKKFRNPPIVIKTALSLLKKGPSLSKVQNYLNQNFRIKVTRKTLMDWKKKFDKNEL